MGKIILLGGSNCQINAVKAAKRRGIETVLVDYLDSPPAAGVADVHVKASTFDVDACMRAARDHKVDGIITLGTDQPVYTAALVSESMGLPYPISSRTALAVTNKKVMKKTLADAGIPAVPYVLVNRENAAVEPLGLAGPLVLKPLDSQGQRGIFKLNSPAEVADHFDRTISFSRESEALVEEYYESDELTFSGWVDGGHLIPLSLTDRQHFEDIKHIGVCVGHRVPTKHMGLYDEVLAISERTVQAFGIENGPIYIQYFVGKRGVLLNELACRIGGAFEDVFIKYMCGFDIIDGVIDLSLGGQVDTTGLRNYSPTLGGREASVQLMICRPGKIGRISPIEEILSLPYVLDAGYNYAVGDVLPTLENATARFGHCVIVGDGDGIESNLRRFYSVLKVEDTDGSSLTIPRDFNGNRL